MNDVDCMIAKSKALFDSMSGLEKAIHLIEQRASFARGFSSSNISDEVMSSINPEFLLLEEVKRLRASNADAEIARLRMEKAVLVEALESASSDFAAIANYWNGCDEAACHAIEAVSARADSSMNKLSAVLDVCKED